ncbi:hypothetical protein RJ527_06430 [Thalassospiraceae bacterium LMO-SO8]|nr:hypothetical protein [Alphaproteobacteria bacterium LMO-S08]WND77374.1 hypothetical protein RJ527_06430 [Thalassospiraceae bacterium LMO-SO8]
MSRWKDLLDSHAVHQTLGELEKAIEGDLKGDTEVELTERRRLVKVIQAWRNILTKVDPELVHMQRLDNLNNHLAQHALTQAKEYANSGNLSSLTAANDNLTTQLTELAILLAIGASQGPVSDVTTKLDEQVDAFAKRVAQKREDLEAQLAATSKAVAEKDQELVKGLAAKVQELKDLEANIETRRQETDQRLSEWQQQFSEAQDRRQTEYGEWSKKLAEESSAAVKSVVDGVDNQLKEKHHNYVQQVDGYLAKAKENHDAIRKLHELSAQDSVAGGYVSNAKKEGEAAGRWRLATVGFILGAVGWLFHSYPGAGVAIHWEAALGVLPMTGVLLFGAAYSAQQSTRHRAVEVQNRRFALEMAAIDPYVQSLDPEIQKELKKELSKRFFGHGEAQDGTSIYDEHAMNHLVQTVSKQLKPIADLISVIRK